MGDYQEYVKSLVSVGAGPQRELEPKATRQHAFGNPFKLDRKGASVDEVGDEVSKEKPEVENGKPSRRLYYYYLWCLPIRIISTFKRC